MRKLYTRFKKCGFDYFLLFRNEKAALFVKTSKSGHQTFEIFRIKSKKLFFAKNDEIVFFERFPGDEDFGKWAFSARTALDAVKRFKRLGGEITQHRYHPYKNSVFINTHSVYTPRTLTIR